MFKREQLIIVWIFRHRSSSDEALEWIDGVCFGWWIIHPSDGLTLLLPPPYVDNVTGVKCSSTVVQLRRLCGSNNSPALLPIALDSTAHLARSCQSLVFEVLMLCHPRTTTPWHLGIAGMETRRGSRKRWEWRILWRAPSAIHYSGGWAYACIGRSLGAI